MKLVKNIILGLYGIQLLLVVPAFLGEMYRAQASPYVWRAYSRELELHGVGSARFLIYAYVVFYSALLFLPYLGIRTLYKTQRENSIIAFVLSLWFPITFLIFADSFFSFLRALPNFLFVIIWVPLTLFVVILWKNLHVETRQKRDQ